MTIKDRAKKIKLLLLDVDGVLTRGEIIYGADGQDYKIFNVKDGLGTYFLHEAGIAVAIITVRGSKTVDQRARDMHVARIYHDNIHKFEQLKHALKDFKVKPSQVCFVGDEIIDVPVLKKVGLAVAVRDARAEAKKAAHYITRACGGGGAVREVCELILKSQNKWHKAAGPFLQ